MQNARVKLTAASTFWFCYQGQERFVPQGGTFEIDSKDFCLFELVARDLVEGKLPSARPTFREQMITKGKELLGLDKPPLPAPSSGDKFPCPHCKQVFTAQKGLDLHLKNAHKDS